ncbi:Tripartite ATP-independent periplasmic transporter DctQ component [Desulfonatronospira thiodismutans ASO3-1]|uniref:Tripartite ATP-independent periplasmic transporter DctQ component n=1 Tax=Desulfonatronospira thiodismutans ASO3-1 TaxID=555779 RepID=D6SKH4_9BACT|nr:TRAP transporter small permease [Desulfonatronospira thiodismutans]EFI36377.1 Tripartite ATP-independent periplasmic transporter DctQ component [Desulfonatronospira thiodismutans ASO3-1]
MPKILRLIGKFYDNFEEFFCALTMGIMVACLMVQVSVRWTTGSGMAWTEELSRYAFVWTVFIGAALVAKHGSHVRISAQFFLLPIKARLVCRFFTDLLWIAFNLYFAWLSWQVLQDGLLFPHYSPVLGIVREYVEMIIPLGFVLMSWRILEGYIRRWRQGTLKELVEQVY